MSSNKFKIITSKIDHQVTIKEKISLLGSSPYIKGRIRVDLIPGEVDSGINFEFNGIRIPATIEYTKKDDKSHTTSLVNKNIELKTVEHLLAAIWGMGIDNVIIKLYSKYIPFLDSSAEGYVKKIKEVGMMKQDGYRKYIKVLKKIIFTESSESEGMIMSQPANNLTINSTTVFDNIVGSNTINLNWNPKKFAKEISWARSFLRSLLDGKGAKWNRIRKIFPNLPVDPRKSPIIVYDKDGFFTPLKAKDEPARHKVLDFLGDISLLGYRLLAKVDLNLPGHYFTCQTMREIKSSILF